MKFRQIERMSRRLMTMAKLLLLLPTVTLLWGCSGEDKEAEPKQEVKEDQGPPHWFFIHSYEAIKEHGPGYISKTEDGETRFQLMGFYKTEFPKEVRDFVAAHPGTPILLKSGLELSLKDDVEPAVANAMETKNLFDQPAELRMSFFRDPAVKLKADLSGGQKPHFVFATLIPKKDED